MCLIYVYVCATLCMFTEPFCDGGNIIVFQQTKRFLCMHEPRRLTRTAYQPKLHYNKVKVPLEASQRKTPLDTYLGSYSEALAKLTLI